MDTVLSTALVVFTEQEFGLITTLLILLEKQNPEMRRNVLTRLHDLEELVSAISRFPSLLENRVVLGEARSRGSLIEDLLVRHDGDRMLHLPSKAVLGKGFLVTKYHTFDLLYRVAQRANAPDDLVTQLRLATTTLLFTIMAEDVYLNLLDSEALTVEMRRQAALMLIVLWEHRTDLLAKDSAPVLQGVWNARQHLLPVYGSMMGISELVLLSMNIGGEGGDTWEKFIKTRLPEKRVTMALEEFLMGLSYEQIIRLRTMLREQKIAAINRDEVESFLGEPMDSKSNTDPRDFYMLYTVRRDNARTRKRLGFPGPHNTLEDYYLSFSLKNFDPMRFNEMLLHT
jgi:hypothetical protein